VNKTEARTIIQKELERYKSKSYIELQCLLEKVDAYVTTASSGKTYQIEVHAIWDDKPNGNIRVFCEASSGLWSSIFPLTCSYIMSSAGKFIDG
jgi:hypothetical protein